MWTLDKPLRWLIWGRLNLIDVARASCVSKAWERELEGRNAWAIPGLDLHLPLDPPNQRLRRDLMVALQGLGLCCHWIDMEASYWGFAAAHIKHGGESMRVVALREAGNGRDATTERISWDWWDDDKEDWIDMTVDYLRKHFGCHGPHVLGTWRHPLPGDEAVYELSS